MRFWKRLTLLNDIDMNCEDWQSSSSRNWSIFTDKYIELEKIEADRAKSEAELALKAESDKSRKKSTVDGSDML